MIESRFIEVHIPRPTPGSNPSRVVNVAHIVRVAPAISPQQPRNFPHIAVLFLADGSRVETDYPYDLVLARLVDDDHLHEKPEQTQ